MLLYYDLPRKALAWWNFQKFLSSSRYWFEKDFSSHYAAHQPFFEPPWSNQMAKIGCFFKKVLGLSRYWFEKVSSAHYAGPTVFFLAAMVQPNSKKFIEFLKTFWVQADTDLKKFFQPTTPRILFFFFLKSPWSNQMAKSLWFFQNVLGSSRNCFEQVFSAQYAAPPDNDFSKIFVGPWRLKNQQHGWEDFSCVLLNSRKM